ncbi:MAG: transglutaminase family protein, partial [Deltaproteobacteria bacterium]|nr:transglutaminase family protein [Deltaproteobacteria bacterium]
MKYQLTHKTRYLYSQPVSYCRNEACLLPRDTVWQQCLSSRLEIEPTAVDLRERNDAFGNRLSHFAIQQTHKELLVTAISEVSIAAIDHSPMLTGEQLAWDAAAMRFPRETSMRTLEDLPYLYDSVFVKSSEQLADYARPTFQAGRPLIDAATELMQRIYRDFAYDPESTTIATPLAEVLKNRRGVCQDFAHLAIGCLR